MSLSSGLHDLKRKSLGLSIEILAELSGINARRLTPYFSGARGLPNTESENIERLLNELARLAEYASPFVLPKNTQTLTELLERQRAGEFDQPRVIAA
jgi:hypothetical protein